MNKCAKYELDLSSECNVIDRCSCCHGNKISIARRSFVASDRPNEELYQILTLYDFRVQSYLHSHINSQLGTCMTRYFPYPTTISVTDFVFS